MIEAAPQRNESIWDDYSYSALAATGAYMFTVTWVLVSYGCIASTSANSAWSKYNWVKINGTSSVGTFAKDGG
jgi:hypothetical protein